MPITPATIAKIKAEVSTGTKKELIQQAATKTDADNLALKLLEIDGKTKRDIWIDMVDKREKTLTLKRAKL